MPSFDTLPTEPYLSFDRGINLDAPPTMLDRGYYADAVNMLLSSDNGGRHPSSMKLDVALDAAITWPSGNPVWFSPYTFSQYQSTTGGITSNTHILIHRTTGTFYRYDPGTPGTLTLVRRLPDAAADLTTHFIYDQWLCVLNGRDAPFKYGQHFLYEGQQEGTPYLFPIGSKPVTVCGPSLVTEVWNFDAAGGGGFREDSIVPDGGSRVGTHSLLIGNGSVTLDYAGPRNFESGPQPYGGTNFADTDFLVFQYYRETGTGGVRIEFETSNDTHYFRFDVSVTTPGSWQTVVLERGDAVEGGVPDWANIGRITFTNLDAGNFVYFDDVYFLYANAPPAAQVGTAHKERIVLGGVPFTGDNNDPALSTLFWSSSAKPDEFPSSNTQVMAGGATSIARTNRITALREYGDSVIVGTQNSILSWTTGTTGEPSRSVITTETGIDSPRAIIETPSGSLLFPWQRGFYILRQTGRSYASTLIAPLLNNIWLGQPEWTVGLRDDKTRTIRLWWRTKDTDDIADPTLTTEGVVFDYVRAQDVGEAVWASRMTQMADFATEAYINGVRETLYCRFDQPGLYRMHVDAGGLFETSVTLPWIARQGRNRVTQWAGLEVPYKASTPVRVFVRFASNPGEFDDAQYEEFDSLPSNPTVAIQGRVMFGRPSRWAQVKLQAQEFGFELYPPIEYVVQDTPKQP